MSFDILEIDWHTPERKEAARASTFLVQVWPDITKVFEKPNALLTISSNFFTLCTGRSLNSPETQSGNDVLDVVVIDYKVLQPERGAFPDSGELRRLEMSKPKCRQVFVLNSEFLEIKYKT